MDDEGRQNRRVGPGRRYEDALVRELVRKLLKDEGYMTAADVERELTNFVPRGEHHQAAVDRRAGILVWIAAAGIVVSPILSALVVHWIG